MILHSDNAQRAKLIILYRQTTATNYLPPPTGNDLWKIGESSKTVAITISVSSEEKCNTGCKEDDKVLDEKDRGNKNLCKTF